MYVQCHIAVRSTLNIIREADLKEADKSFKCTYSN